MYGQIMDIIFWSQKFSLHRGSWCFITHNYSRHTHHYRENYGKEKPFPAICHCLIFSLHWLDDFSELELHCRLCGLAPKQFEHLIALFHLQRKLLALCCTACDTSCQPWLIINNQRSEKKPAGGLKRWEGCCCCCCCCTLLHDYI